MKWQVPENVKQKMDKFAEEIEKTKLSTSTSSGRNTRN